MQKERMRRALLKTSEVLSALCEREAKKPRKKRRLIRRWDIGFFLGLIILGLIMAIVPRALPAVPVTHGSGRGCFNSNLRTCDAGGYPSTVNPVDEENQVGADSSTNGKTIAGQTYNSADQPDNLPASNDAKGDWLIDANHGGLFYTDPTMTVDNPSLQSFWQSAVAIVGFLLALAFTVTGYRVMAGAVGFRYADAIETLPRILLAAIASMTSILLAGFLIAIFNGIDGIIVATAINNKVDFNLIVMPLKYWGNNTLLFFTSSFAVWATFMKITSNTSITALVDPTTYLAGGVLITALATFVLHLQNFIRTWLTIMLGAVFIMQEAMICLDIICLPFFFLLGTLPLSEARQAMRQGFMSLILLLVAKLGQTIVIASGGIIFTALANTPDVELYHVQSLFNVVPIPSIVIPHIGQWLSSIAILWLVIRVPTMFQSSALSTVASAGKAVSGITRAISDLA